MNIYLFIAIKWNKASPKSSRLLGLFLAAHRGAVVGCCKGIFVICVGGDRLSDRAMSSRRGSKVLGNARDRRMSVVAGQAGPPSK